MEDIKRIKASYVPAGNVYNKASEDAYALLKYAEDYTDKMISEARHKCAKKINSIYKRSKKLGFRNGEKEFLAERAKNISKELCNIDEYVRNLKEDCFTTALSVAKEVIQYELSTSTNSLYKRIKNALSAIPDHQSVRIFVNPSDTKKLVKAHPELKDYLLSNESILQGNAIINSAIGRIELDWQEHFEIISKALASQFNA